MHIGSPCLAAGAAFFVQHGDSIYFKTVIANQ